MRKIFSNAFKRSSYIMISSFQKELAKDFCINLVVQLAELDTRMFIDRKKNILFLAHDVKEHEAKVETLQKEYYPKINIQENINIASIYHFIKRNPWEKFSDLDENEMDFEILKNYVDVDEGEIDFERLKIYVAKHNIKLIYADDTMNFWCNRDNFQDFCDKNSLSLLHYNDNELDVADVTEWITTIVNNEYSDGYLFSYLNEKDEIVSVVIPDEAFVQL